MAEPRPQHGPLQVHVDYLFDRLHDSKLAQVYGILVPVRERPVGGSVKEFDHEGGGDLCGGPGCSDSFRRFLSGGSVFRFRLPGVLADG